MVNFMLYCREEKIQINCISKHHENQNMIKNDNKCCLQKLFEIKYDDI